MARITKLTPPAARPVIRSSLLLRVLIYAQIVWIPLVSILEDGGILYAFHSSWHTPRALADLLMLPAVALFWLFPIATIAALFRSDLSSERGCVVLLIQLGLSIAYFIAIMPFVQ